MTEFFPGEQVFVRDVIPLSSRMRLHVLGRRRWVEQACRLIKCGRPHTLELKRLRGITVDEHTSIDSLVRGSLGLDGIAVLTSEIAARTGHDVRFETGVEETGTFEVQPPRCGRQIISLFQLQDVYDFRLDDSRWFQGSGWSKTIRVWRDEILDMSPPPEPDASCGCRQDELPDSVDGVVFLVLGNLRVLLGYREDADGTSFPALRAACPAGLGVLLGAEIEIAKELLPPYLAFLSDLRGDMLVGRLGPCFPAGARNDFGERGQRLRVRSEGATEES